MSSSVENGQQSATQVSEEEAYTFAMQLTNGAVLPMVVKSAIELDLFEIIAKAGPGAFLSPTEIALQLPTNNPDAPSLLDRILCLLTSHSILTCSSRALPDGRFERLYALAPASKFLTKDENGVSLAAHSLLAQDKICMESLYYLKDAVLEGSNPFEKAHGINIFDYQNKDPNFKKMFKKAMSSISTILMKKTLDTYKGFEGLKSLVDVGGGTGATLNLIISKYPSIQGINFDLPYVIEDSPSYPGVEHVGGDMFVSVPKGDAIFMKSILHDWSDEQCLKILKNSYEALPEDGKVIVFERIFPATPDQSPGSKVHFIFDCSMLARCPGGKERTEDDFKSLSVAAGFHGFKLVCSAYSTFHIMEFLKIKTA